MTTTGSPRMVLRDLAPESYKAMLAFARTADGEAVAAGVEPKVLELVKIRASMINGCAFCIDMHTIDARAAGETEQRIYALIAWRETPFFTARERAALALTDAVTSLHDGHVSDEAYREVVDVLGEKQTGVLIMVATVINSWNRIAISARLAPGPADSGQE